MASPALHVSVNAGEYISCAAVTPRGAFLSMLVRIINSDMNGFTFPPSLLSGSGLHF